MTESPGEGGAAPPRIPEPGLGTEGPRVPTIGASVRFLFGIAALFILGGGFLQLLIGEAALAVGQVVFVIVPTILFVRWGEYDPYRTLSLRLPRADQVGGGVLLLIGGIQIAWLLAWLQTFVLPIPTEYLEAMSEALAAETPGRILWVLLVAAVLPAIAEEGVFRGVFLSALRTRMPGVWTALLSGVVFGLFHLMPGTVFRFLPTAWLGFLFGLVVVFTGSLPLAVLLHFLNNAAVVVLSILPVPPERVADPGAPPPLATLPLAVVFLVWGVRILRRGAAAEDRDGSSDALGRAERLI